MHDRDASPARNLRSADGSEDRGAPSPALPAAVLWDMDGTLVDTEPSWMATESALVAEFGGTWTTDDALGLVGVPIGPACRILQDHGVALTEEQITARLMSGMVDEVSRTLAWQPGALDLLTALRSAGVPCALVTMSYRVLAEAVIGRLPAGTFAAVVTGDEVTHSKPHPEAYLRAASLLGVAPERCVAIEDSPTGVTSALASGARTLGVQHLVPVEARPGLSRAGSLADVGLAELRRIVAGEDLDLLTASVAG